MGDDLGELHLLYNKARIQSKSSAGGGKEEVERASMLRCDDFVYRFQRSQNLNLFHLRSGPIRPNNESNPPFLKSRQRWGCDRGRLGDGGIRSLVLIGARLRVWLEIVCKSRIDDADKTVYYVTP
ncbi:hypothetical protein RRG08_041920 [Elysia crispata]|uniref:Uncharacterized protein n=1 Tax=Elysia crispata TaxID=231223 RepID=A0AAE0XXD6_9GAST|nr:hypothetical protein RRG08_041920 [Elysia crispata]